MEYCDGGDLFNLVNKCIRLKRMIGELDLWKILVQILLAVSHLHKNRILHRDIKSANAFLFADGRVKLGDFNVA